MASVVMAPHFVAPKDMMSTPARQVSSAGEHPTLATALAKRAPSMWTFMPYRLATADSAATSAGA